jgi:hypothetical protein
MRPAEVGDSIAYITNEPDTHDYLELEVTAVEGDKVFAKELDADHRVDEIVLDNTLYVEDLEDGAADRPRGSWIFASP